MTNSKKDIDKVTEHALHAAVVGNGKAAEEAARRIDSEFILIKRSDLPAVVFNQFYGTHKARSASYNPKTSAEVYWSRALDFLSIAQHAEVEEGKQEERELAGKRDEAYRMLYPKAAPLWSYSDLSDMSKAQIDVVVGLMVQVDTLKDGK